MRGIVRQDEEPHRGLTRDLPAEAAALIDAAAMAHRSLLALITSLAAGTGDGGAILELVAAGARLGENSASLRDIAAALEDAAVGQFALTQAHAAGVAEGIGIAAARARVPRQGKGRHASAGWRASPIMTVVKVAVPAAAAGAWGALKLAASHGRAHVALTAHTARIAAMTTGGTGVAAVLTVAAVHTMSPVAAHPGRYAGPSPSAPAASAWSASRMSSSPPATPVAHGRADANRAGPAGIVPLAPWSPLPSPSLSPSPVLTPAPVTGTLSADVTAADLSSGQQVTITLYANGAPVNWHAWCSDAADVSVSAASGTASPGMPSLLTLTPAPAQDGVPATECHIWPGAIQVAVTLPQPVPSASPAATDTPTPGPSSS